MHKEVGVVLVAGLLSGAAPAFAQEGDASAGETVFKRCQVCHVVDSDQNKVGPTLQNVIGRTPGTVEGFRYSKAMQEFGEDHVWDEETLTEYLAAPREVVKGTTMAFAGLKEEQQIADVIAYLKQFSDTGNGEAED